MRIEVRDNGSNPLIIVSPERVMEWLRSLADEAGYADRASSIVQIGVEREFTNGATTHWEVPELVFMVSNIPNSREPKEPPTNA